ncbi:hypothetical protein D3C87_1712360 [compost metagenome]
MLDSNTQSPSSPLKKLPENFTICPFFKFEAVVNSGDPGCSSVLCIMSENSLFQVLTVMSLAISIENTPLPSLFAPMCVTLPTQSWTLSLLMALHNS